MHRLLDTRWEAIRSIGICWDLFCVVWVIAALSAKRTARPWSPFRRWGYTALMVVTIWALFWSPWQGARLLPRTREAALAGLGLVVAGLILAVWSRLALARNWSGAVVIKEGHELVERGPYRWIRHPIYTGLTLMVLGSAVAIGTLVSLLCVAVFIVLHVWKLRQEEALLSAHFPAAYPAYKSRTKRLIPGIY